MKKYITILSVLAVSAVFADNEIFTGDQSGKSFIGESHRNSVWDGVIARDTEFSRYTTEYDTTYNSDYTNASFRNADLTNASFAGATMNDIDATDAIIKGASFYNAKMNDMAILTKTKSYKDKDLSGVDLRVDGFKITKIYIYDFSGFNLTGAYLCANLYNPDNPNYTNPDGIFKYDDAIILGATMSKIAFRKEQLCSTKSYKDKMLDGITVSEANFANIDFRGVSLKNTTFSYMNLSNANFSNANLSGAKISWFDQSASRYAEVYSLKNAVFFNADLTNAELSYGILENVDFRGANMTNTKIGESVSYKNTIMSDGVIKNFKADPASDIYIRKYTPVENGEIISAKIAEEDATLNGSRLMLGQGAFFEITNGKTLTNSSEIQIDTDLGGSTIFKVDGNAGLTFEHGAKLTVNLIGDISEEDAYTFTAMTFEDDARIAGLEDLLKDENLFLTVLGKKFNGSWDYAIKDNNLLISINVPEPATYAAIFGALALAFAAYRRRK